MSRPIHIDRERCMGSGVCQFWAPATFGLDDQCKAIVLDPQGDPEAAIQHAVDACPTRAIELQQAVGQGPTARSEPEASGVRKT